MANIVKQVVKKLIYGPLPPIESYMVNQHRKGLRAPFFSGGMLLTFPSGVLLHLYIIFRNRRERK